VKPGAKSGKHKNALRTTANGVVERKLLEERPCDCPPGWQHKRDCHVVTGKEPDAS
jgi:hypothetical protein